jgi:Tol biopolymer transport system component
MRFTRIAVASAICLVLVPVSESAHAAFPGSDGRIIYGSVNLAVRPRNRSRILSIAPDGTGRRAISPPFRRDSEFPSWSADGSMVAYVRHMPTPGVGLGGPNDPETLVTANVDGSGAKAILPYVRQGLRRIAASPAWSPDDSQIAFCAYLHFNVARIYVVNSDGTGLRKLTVGPYNDCDPSWSPDGTSIAVDSSSGGIRGTSEVVLLDATTGARTDLVHGAFPDWSPDGTHLVLARSVGRTSDLFTVRTDGSGLTNITRTPNAFELSPSYSPSGAFVVYAASNFFHQGPEDLWIRSSDGSGNPRRLLHTPHRDEYSPHWQPV